MKSETHQKRAPGSGQPLSSLSMRARKVPAARWDHPFALHNSAAGWTAPHALESLWKSPAWKSFAVWCVLGALLWNVNFGLAQNRPGRPEHQTNSIVSAPQVRVNPHTIALPIVDEKGIRFTRLSTDEGLSQTKVYQIIQDDQGFMWFGTQYGLNRYDGYTFKVFVHDPKNPNSLSGVEVDGLFKDRDGVLWVGCDQFLNKFNRETETFTRYPVPFVTDISQESTGILWLATVNGLYSLDPKTGSIRHYSHNSNDPSSLSTNQVISSGEDKEGSFWVATRGHLDEFDRKTGKVTRDISIPLSSAFRFYEDRFGVFWIFHNSPNALSVFDRKTSTLSNYSFHEPDSCATALTVVMDVTEDRDGNLWLATHGAGLLEFDREHQRLIRYRNSPSDPNSLPQNDLERLFADREGSVWAALGRMGVIHFSTIPMPFKTIPHLTSSEGMAQPFVGAIYEDPHGILWIGTPEALNSIDRKTGQHTSYRGTPGPAVNTDVIAINEDNSGNLWAGTYDHGLLRLDRKTGHFQIYRHNPADRYSLSNDVVTRLLVDHSGSFWVATDDGLNRFDPATGHFTVFKADPRKIVQYLAMVEDRQGMLWLGTDSSGLERFNPATGQFTTYEHDIDHPLTLSDNRVNSVHFDRTGTMWVGTQNGLNKFDSKTGTFTAYTRRDGLPGNAVGCVLEDAHGILWMSTNNGIVRFDPKSTAIRSYSTAEGLPGPDLTGWGACFKNRTGEMFFGGFNGATAFHPDSVVDPSNTPQVVLTELRLSGSPVDIGEGSPLSKSITYTPQLTLSHDQRIFSLAFSTLSFLSPGTNRYRYMLEGLDDTWHEVRSDERLATYTTLPSREYTFRVQGATSRGPWSEPGVRLRIDILPAWWNSSWFRATYIAALLLILVTIYIYHQQQKKREAEHTEKLRRTQTELAQINRVSTMDELTASLAHEIKQPIGAAVTNAEACIRLIDRSEPDLPEAREAALEVIKDARRAADIIEHVRSLYRKGSSPQEIVDVNEVIREMAVMLQKDANRHSVTMHTDLTDGLPKVMADRVQLQQAMMNLMINGIEAMGEPPGELSIRSQLGEDGQVLISISDTGVGLPTGNADQIFNAFFTTKAQGTGMGLAITRSIVESHGGRIWANANSGPGATFQFTLPMSEAAGR
ncbi:MAG TPA: two-component regulator propeller domain-containing protein [Acidobacteriaceae bacterium]